MQGVSSTDTAALIAVGLLVLAAVGTDVRSMRIPNALTVTFAVAGILYSVCVHGLQGLTVAALGALSGLAPLYLLFRLGGIGGGDVKLFGAAGMWLGPLPTLQLLLGSVLAGGLIALLLLAMRLPFLRAAGRSLAWPWGEHPLDAGGGTKFPFMLAVAPAYGVLLIL